MTIFVRVTSQIFDNYTSYPVVFIARSENAVKNWRIPSKTSGNSLQYSASLCKTSENLRFTVSTRSDQPLRFKISIDSVPDSEIVLEPGQGQTASLSPTSQQLFQVKFRNDSVEQYQLMVKGKSKQPVCSLVSIQPLDNCNTELYDQEQDMRYGNMTLYQTMLNLTALIIERKNYPHGANVVLLAKSNDDGCYQKTDIPYDPDRRFDIEVTISELEEDPLVSTLVVLLIYLLSGLFAILSSCLASRRFGFELVGKLSKYELKLEDTITKRRQQKSTTISISKAYGKWKKSQSVDSSPGYESAKSHVNSRDSLDYIDAVDEPGSGEGTEAGNHVEANDNKEDVIQSSPDNINTEASNEITNKRLKESKPRRLPYQESIEIEDTLDGPLYKHRNIHQLLHDNCVRSRNNSGTNATGSEAYVTKVIIVDKDKIKQKRTDAENVNVADMAVYHNPDYFPNFLSLRSDMFVWLIFLAGIYYTLPVFQLVYYYQETSIK